MRDSGVVAEPTLPVYGVAEFLTVGSYRQMQVLAEYKFPKLGIRAGYYKKARDTIRRFHEAGEDQKVIVEAVISLQNRLEISLKEYERVKTEHNARVLKSYLRNRANKHYKVKPMSWSRMIINGVTVHTNPDLFVVDEEKLKLIKFDFGEKPPNDRFAGIVTECLHRGAQQVKTGSEASSVIFYSIEANREWAAKPSDQRWRNISAACRMIAMLWPNLKPE